MRLDIVTVPYRYDEPNQGLGAGPEALLKGGVVDRVRAAGHDVSEPVAASLDPTEREIGQTAVNIGRLGASTAGHVAAARQAGAGVLVLAGEDTASVGVLAGLQRAHGAAARIGLIWIDAHGDFNTPTTSFSGILAGMPVAVIAGLAGPRWREAAGQLAPVPTDRILIAGVRDLDNQEESLLAATSVTLLSGEQARTGTPVVDAINALREHCDLLMMHIDLDVLDPELVPSSSTPAPLGLDVRTVVTMAEAAYGTKKVAATVISSLNPGGGQLGKRSLATALDLIGRLADAWQESPAVEA